MPWRHKEPDHRIDHAIPEYCSFNPRQIIHVDAVPHLSADQLTNHWFRYRLPAYLLPNVFIKWRLFLMNMTILWDFQQKFFFKQIFSFFLILVLANHSTLYTVNIFLENIKIRISVDIKTAQAVSLARKTKTHSQYHSCWWPGDVRSQGMSSNCPFKFWPFIIVIYVVI